MLDEGGLKLQPLVETRDRDSIGTTRQGLGRIEEAEPILISGSWGLLQREAAIRIAFQFARNYGLGATEFGGDFPAQQRKDGSLKPVGVVSVAMLCLVTAYVIQIYHPVPLTRPPVAFQV